MGRAALVNLGDGFAGRIMAGEGETDRVFWVHGYTLNSTCWTRLWDSLPGWHHLGVDLPGHGNSLPLKPSEELPALARRIGAIASKHKARHLVASSFGSVIALQIAMEFPGVFDTLTLDSPVLGGGPFEPEVWTRYHDVKEQLAAKGLGTHIVDFWMDSGSTLFRGTGRRPEVREHIRRQVARHPWWEAGDDSYSQLWHTPQLLKDLAAITSSTLLLVGEEDGGAVRQCAHFLERIVPQCRRVDLARMGHLCLIQDPPAVWPLLEEHWRSSRTSETNDKVTYSHAAHD